MSIKIEKKMVEMHTDILWIKKSLEGNGNKGLIEQIDDNRKFRHQAKAQMGLMGKIFGSGGIILLIINIIQLIGS